MAAVLGFQRVTRRQAVVVRIHTVNGHLIRRLRQAAAHQADPIHLLPRGKYAQCAAVGEGLFHVEVFIQLHAPSLNGFHLGLVGLLGQVEIAILDVVERKALLIRGQHTVVRHQKSGNKADGGRQQQEDHQVLAQFVPKLPQDAFSQGIFHSAPLTIPGLPPPSGVRCGGRCE